MKLRNLLFASSRQFMFAICLLTLTAYQALAVNYFVSTTGNDANAGTLAAPLRTIQRALNLATPGTVISVRGGTYNERLFWPSSGTVGSTIDLTNYGSEVVYLDGTNATNSTQNAMIAINAKSHLTIYGLQIRNNYRNGAQGIYMLGSGTDVEISNCKIYNIGWTTSAATIPSPSDNANPFVIVGSTSASYNDLYIGFNEIYNCITGYSESLTITGNIDNFLVEKNTIHDNTNIGIVVAGHYSWTGAPASVNQARNGSVLGNTVYRCVSQVATSAGIYVDGGKSITVEGNKSYENGTGISLGCENANQIATGITVRSNFIYNNKQAGMSVGANASGSRVEYSTINNNTFYKNYSVGGYGGEIHLQNTKGITFRSNIIQSRSDIVVIALLGYTTTELAMNYDQYYTASGTANTITFDWGGINGSGYYSLATFKSGTGLETNGRYSNPSFVSGTLPSPNLHLSSTSTAINSGVPGYSAASGEKDIDGQTRVQSTRIDVGADETAYTNAPSVRLVGVVTQTPRLVASPNPSRERITLNADASIRIVTTSGKVALKGEYKSGESIQIGHLPAGIYLLVNEADQSVSKLVVE